MRDERPTVDSQREFNAEQANLTFWQTGAMGLIAPRAVMYFGDNTPYEFQYGAFSWDNTVYDNFPGLPSYMRFTINGTGDFTIDFDTQVLGRPDADGVQQLEALSLQFAWADVNQRSATAERMYAEVDLVDPQTVNVLIHGTAPADEPFVLAVF